VNLDAKENWWGTDDPLEIVAGIYDYFNSSSAAVVDFSSFLDADGGPPTVTALTGETYLIGATYGNTVLNGSYIVPRYYKIQSGHELTVSPGTVIRFMSGSYLIVGTDGTLTAGDSSGEPVTFTSELTVPSAGAWEGIQFAYNSSCTLKNCIIEYADIGFYFNGDTETYITGCTVRNNNTGVSVSSGIPKPVFRRCSFYGNTEYNYSVGSWAAENSANLDAKENWWGTDNPLEISAGIYDYIDSGSAVVVDFSPYLDSKMNIYDYSSMLEWQNMMANYGADLDDVIFILQILSGQNTDNPFLDLDEDQKTGLPEAILIMQYLAGLRSTASPEECFLGGVIFTDMTLGLSGSPYTLTNNIRILPGATLTIEPGVIIQFAGAYSIWVDGSLDALGTEANPVTFTSAKNTPYPGDWRGIYFDEGASGNIDHSLIEYAYQGIECYKSSPGIRNSTIQNSSRTGIYLNYSSSAVENNSIQNNGWIMALYNYNYNGWAIALYNSSPQITGNTITDNHNGISINYNCYPVISNNSIYDNSDGESRFDIKVGSYTNADTVIINASNNWWGSVALNAIEPNIYDYSDSANSARILYNPILDSPDGTPINAVVIIKDVSVSSAFITPFAGEQTVISYTLTEDTLVTIEIYRAFITLDGKAVATYQREFFMTLADRQSKTAGQHTQVWDGRDSSGNIAEPSAYVYVIKADSGNNRIDLYDPRYVSGSVSISDNSITPSLYNPYANERVEVKYSLFMPAWVSIGGYGMPEFIIEAVPRKQGVNTEIWDGRDGIGDIVDKNVTLAAKAEILPENAIVLMQDSSLQIKDVSTDAYVIIPAYGEISTVKYSLSKNATVSISISDPNGNDRTLLEAENQSAGAHAIEWDGTDGNGRIVWPWSDGPEGDYTVQIKAVDSVSNTTVTENANIHVYR
jgi:parallel beta-helix repeat protein